MLTIKTQDTRRPGLRLTGAGKTRGGFTLIELVVAIGLLSIVLVFSGAIFKASIGSYRTAMAQAEIMRKLRVITEQLDSDFQGLQKDGFLILRSQVISRREYPADALPGNFRADRLYYFCTGDFQSWFNSGLRSNIARVYFGHEGLSLVDATITVNRWRLARDAQLICPGEPIPAPPAVVDYNNISFAEYKANPTMVVTEADTMLASPPNVVAGNPNTIGRLLCENAGQMAIGWTDGTKDPNNAIAWFGFNMPRSVGGTGIPADARYADPIDPIESFSPVLYSAMWKPSTLQNLWPQVLKFTFTLYDSRGVFKNGQTFTHIVYLGD